MHSLWANLEEERLRAGKGRPEAERKKAGVGCGLDSTIPGFEDEVGKPNLGGPSHQPCRRPSPQRVPGHPQTGRTGPGCNRAQEPRCRGKLPPLAFPGDLGGPGEEAGVRAQRHGAILRRAGHKDRATCSREWAVSKNRGLLGPCAQTAGWVWASTTGGGKWKVEGGGRACRKRPAGPGCPNGFLRRFLVDEVCSEQGRAGERSGRSRWAVLGRGDPVLGMG